VDCYKQVKRHDLQLFYGLLTKDAFLTIASAQIKSLVIVVSKSLVLMADTLTSFVKQISLKGRQGRFLMRFRGPLSR
jgi:hypothetical protein